MRRPRALVAVFTALMVVVGVGWLIWFRQAKDVFELKVVRQTLEDGRPVVYFRVEGGEGRRIQIGEIEQLAGDRVLQWADLLAVYRDPRTAGRKDLRLVAPTNVPTWKLRVTVYVEPASLVGRYNMLVGQWRMLRSMKYSVARTLKEIWTTPLYSESYAVESDSITNTTAPTLQARSN